MSSSRHEESVAKKEPERYASPGYHPAEESGRHPSPMSEPWTDAALYATYQEWIFQPDRCIGPLFQGHDLRCFESIILSTATPLADQARNMPRGPARDQVIRDLLVSLCCDRSHREHLVTCQNDVLPTLIEQYGKELAPFSTENMTGHFQTINIANSVAVLSGCHFDVSEESPSNASVGQLLLSDTSHENDAAVGFIFCATWSSWPSYVLIDVATTSVETEMARWQQYFPGLTPEFSVPCAYPQRTLRLILAELREYGCQVVSCAAEGRRSSKWCRAPVEYAIPVVESWHRLNDATSLYTEDGTLTLDWRTRIMALPGRVFADRLLWITSEDDDRLESQH